MLVHVTIQLKFNSVQRVVIIMSSSTGSFYTLFMLQLHLGKVISPRVLKAIYLGWSNHQQNLYPNVFTPSPILKVPYQTLPITEIPQIPHFRTNPSFLLQPGNFLGWTCVLPFWTPSPHSLFEIQLYPTS